MARGRDARPSRPKKTYDERSHEAFDHEPRVRDCRVLDDNPAVIERPKQNAQKSEDGAERKEQSKRFLAAIDRRLRRRGSWFSRRHCAVGLALRWKPFAKSA